MTYRPSAHERVKADVMGIIGGHALAMANITKDDQNIFTCMHNSQLPGTSRATQGTRIGRFTDKSNRER